MSKTKKKFNSFYRCSPVEVVHYPPVMVLEEDGFVGSLVPEKPLSGDYRDYSIQSLIDAGITLKRIPQGEPTIEDVEKGIQQLENYKNQLNNENEN